MPSADSLEGSAKSVAQRSNIRWHTSGGCQYELWIVMPIRHGNFMNFMMYGIYFVGWTEMCSRHGDTAKLNIDGAGFLFLLINLFGRRISWMGQQRCDKDNRYAMPLERSIEVCISLIIRLDSLFLIQCWRSRLKQPSTSGGSLKRPCRRR